MLLLLFMFDASFPSGMGAAAGVATASGIGASLAMAVGQSLGSSDANGVSIPSIAIIRGAGSFSKTIVGSGAYGHRV